MTQNVAGKFRRVTATGLSEVRPLVLCIYKKQLQMKRLLRVLNHVQDAQHEAEDEKPSMHIFIVTHTQIPLK